MWGFLLEEGDNDNEEEETSMNSWPKLRVKTLLPLALAVVMVAGSWAGVASYLGATAGGVARRGCDPGHAGPGGRGRPVGRPDDVRGGHPHAHRDHAGPVSRPDPLGLQRGRGLGAPDDRVEEGRG